MAAERRAVSPFDVPTQQAISANSKGVASPIAAMAASPAESREANTASTHVNEARRTNEITSGAARGRMRRPGARSTGGILGLWMADLRAGAPFRRPPARNTTPSAAPVARGVKLGGLRTDRGAGGDPLARGDGGRCGRYLGRPPARSMPAFSPANIADSDQGLFSPVQMERLMRGEFYRSRRYGHSLVCMLIAVDRLGSLQDLYGLESKFEILRGVVDLLGRSTRASDVLGMLVDDRLLAIFPHTSRRGAGTIAHRLLKGAREQVFESDGRRIRATLSIGAADTSMDDIEEFDKLVNAAREGLGMALEAGGDQYVVREEVQSELDRLQAKLEELRGAVPAQQHGTLTPEPAVEGPHLGAGLADLVDIGAEGEDSVVARIRAVFSSLGIGRSPEIDELERQIIALALRELQEERRRAADDSAGEYTGQIDLLERRVAKLSSMLGMTEAELKRVLAMKNIDPGLASIYRVVQGLSVDESNSELKNQLMQKIFEANLELKKQIAPEGERG
jgi:diguanylate cyclase (GGDEF)-like protein